MPSALLAILQFFFALTWVVYVIYLPGLADQVGFERRHVPVILMLDQVVFLACDWAAGMYSDRIARKFGRIGPTMAMVTLVSCAAFIALPFIAPNVGKMPFLFLTLVWSVTSSALRAPPFAIVGRHANSSSRPWVACAYLFGLGVAGAAAPYVAVELREVDPRIPFTLSSIGLAAFAFALARVERTSPPPSATAATPDAVSPARASLPTFAVILLLFAFGYQVHFAMNSGPSYLRFARMEDLPHLMPVFWIGFNLALLPAALLAKHIQGRAIMVAGGVVGVIALSACARAPSLAPLVAAQAFAGVAWSLAMMGAFSGALESGRPGREGLFTGVLFSALAAAALSRLLMVVSGLQASSKAAAQLENLPFIAWALAAFLMATIAFSERREDAK